MKTQLHLDMLGKATEMMEKIQELEKMRDMSIESANGFGGDNFPDQKQEWLDSAKRYEERIGESWVVYRMYLNSIR